MSTRSVSVSLAAAAAGLALIQGAVASQFGAVAGARDLRTQDSRAQDPGVRTGPAAAGDHLPALLPQELEYFTIGKEDFEEVESIEDGLGPRLNLDSCGSCHAHPAVGGSSPAVNPQVAFARQGGGRDRLPSFIQLNGPVREVRFVRNRDGSPDGGVHALFTIAGRPGAGSCDIDQPDFAQSVAARNAIFRTPTPVFGAGLIEQIPDAVIVANQNATSATRRLFGVRGRPNFQVSGRTITGQTNHNGNDGTIARFGWKAQNKSLLIFSGEAYNVEMGITNDLFQTERDENENCQYADMPNSVSDLNATSPQDAMSSVEKFSIFMRFLAAPVPSADTPGGAPSIARGRSTFEAVGCATCHTPELTTGRSAVAALANQKVALFSDLMVHDMGDGLADGVSQGEAGPRDFRTAPLWGLGQRIFFLHDGRTADLHAAIRAHQSTGSEANSVVDRYLNLGGSQRQDLLNFLRSL
jgi:CxxC motif-containing protein (DUF1111 family)